MVSVLAPVFRPTQPHAFSGEIVFIFFASLSGSGMMWADEIMLIAITIIGPDS